MIEMGGRDVASMGKEEMQIGFWWETWRKEAAWKKQAEMRGG